MTTYMNGGGEWVRQLPDGTTVNLVTGRIEVLGDSWRQDADLRMGTITKDVAILRAIQRAQEQVVAGAR
jgi:hypothetical protein